MRILHICAYTWAIGGPARIIYDFTRIHAQQGHEVTILTPFSDTDKLYMTAPNVQVLPFKRHPFSRFFPEFSLGLWDYLKKHGNEYDLIHVHGLWHFGSIAPFLLGLRSPKVTTLHGLLDPWALRQGYWKKRIMSMVIQKRFVRQSELIHLHNDIELNALDKYIGYRHPNILMLPNGLPVTHYRNLPSKGTFRKKYDIRNDQRIVLFLGRLNSKKGLDLLLPAFQTLSQAYPDLILVLAGPDDGYLAETEEFLKTNQLSDRARLTGLLVNEDKLAAFADATLFVLPSYSEGYSIAGLEALASGIPSVMTTHVGYGDDLRQYEAAYVCETTTESVQAGVSYLLDHPEKATEYARNGLRMVEEKADIDLLANHLLNAYYKLLLKPI